MSDLTEPTSRPARQRSLVRGALAFSLTTAAGMALLLALGFAPPAAASISVGASFAALILAAA